MFKSLFFSIAFVFTLVFCMGSFTHVQAEDLTIQWMTWEEAIEKSKIEKKKIFVDLYTDWCSWCKKMDATTFKDPVVINYINNNFYPVKFNAEMKETILFKGKEYKFIKSGERGYHELALWMTNGDKLAYPNMIFINEDLKVSQAIPGYHPTENFELIMTYFGDEHNKKTPWDIYKKKYGDAKHEGGSLPTKGK